MSACHVAPHDKRALVSAVGEELVSRHGKRRTYRAAQVRSALEARNFPIDVHCWAYCIFLSAPDFEGLHRAMGEVCDQAAMKAEVLADLAGDGAVAFVSSGFSWLQWPDLSSLFDWFDRKP